VNGARLASRCRSITRRDWAYAAKSMQFCDLI
jgi:hypothetical protein